MNKELPEMSEMVEIRENTIDVPEMDFDTFMKLWGDSIWYDASYILPPSSVNVYGEILKPIPENCIALTEDGINFSDYDIVYYNYLGKCWVDKQECSYKLSDVKRWSFLPNKGNGFI